MFELQAVSHKFRKTLAVDNVTAEFEPGATVLLGPNGAGKSTLMEIAASVLQPSVGSVRLNGRQFTNGSRKDRASFRKAVAWLPQLSSVAPGLEVREHVAYAAWLKGMRRDDAWVAAEQAIRAVGLSRASDKPVRSLSGGQQRRVAIAGALAHDAKVFLLDEPTAGLDPAQRKTFRTILERMSEEKIVIVSSHDTDDAHAAFQRVAVLRSGRLAFHGTMSEFLKPTDSSKDPRDRIEAAYLQIAGGEE